MQRHRFCGQTAQEPMGWSLTSAGHWDLGNGSTLFIRIWKQPESFKNHLLVEKFTFFFFF